MIFGKQLNTQWGDKLISQLSNDLKSVFPEMKWLSETNLKYCKRFYTFCNPLIGQQPVDQLSENETIQFVNFALRDINKPMGVSEFQFTGILLENLKSSLPTVEEIENELMKVE